MKHLLYKELSISINKFFFMLPILLAALMLIPNWFFMLVFMYFFWITVPNMHATYNQEEDQNFVSILPVSKKAFVSSRVMAIVILEAVHVFFAILFGLLHNYLYGTYNFALDINFSLFGLAILMYGIFNITFLPYYYRTAYFFGKPAILAAVVTIIYAFFVEYLTLVNTTVSRFLEGSVINQLIVLASGIIIFVILTYIAIKRSQKNFIEAKK